jgi:hypothetical protein
MNMGMKIEEHECNNVDGLCGVCKTPMVGHLTLERHQEIVEKNKAWWHEFRQNRDESLKNLFSNGIVIGCKIDSNDKSFDAKRRYANPFHGILD